MLDFLLAILSCSGTPTAYCLLLNEMVGAAIFISIAVISLAYMVGEAFSMPSIKAFSKVEISELAVSVIILLVAAMLLSQNSPYDLLAKGFLNSKEKDLSKTVCPEWLVQHPYDASSSSFKSGSIAFGQAEFFLGCKPNLWGILLAAPAEVAQEAAPELSPEARQGILKRLEGFYDYVPAEGVILPRMLQGYIRLTGYEVMIGFLSTLSFSLDIPADEVSILTSIIGLQVGTFLSISGIMPLQMLTLMSEANVFILDGLSMAWSVFAAQKMLLSFIELAVPLFFLPIGILMRALPFTRKTGSTIIAVCFAAYFIFPLSILLCQQAYDAIQNPTGPNGCIPGEAGCCKAVEEKCTHNSDCCSLECRPSRNVLDMGAFRCASQLTDFHEYTSALEICSNGGSTAADLEERRAAITEQEDYFNKVNEIAGNEPNSAATKTEARLRDEMDAMKAQQALGNLGKPYAFLKGVGAMIGNTPNSILKASIMDVSKYIVVGMLFTVFEIIITMTLMKDFALLIGGEPRVFGLSKLV